MAENLEVASVNFFVVENAVEHHTDKFELVHDEEPVPILRRGQKFSMSIKFSNRKFDVCNDLVRLVFNFGKTPNVIKGTQGVMRLTLSNEILEASTLWSVNIVSEDDDGVTLDVISPADSPVGIWSLEIETSTENSDIEPSVYKYEQIYLLFNPWNCDDLVYMPDERLLDEYILADVGKIWVGSWRSSRGRDWVFGQFDANVLPAVMFMFDLSKLADVSRGDPILTTRIISKLVNYEDDNGILMGNWSGYYADGTAPSAWTGSVDILKQYLETRNTVKYGQCWVFSAVVTTICRAIGIPCRSVSNFVSAHDGTGSLTIEKFYDENNEEKKDEGKYDSIWNFHVWNDVWMARPDLPIGYGGWQAIDATPQETSHGFFQCGPASLKAIHQGIVGYNYDVGFVLAAINADLMKWKYNPNRDIKYSKISCDKYHIGRAVLTKQPFIYDPNGEKDREDITEQYKAKEGTSAERLGFYNAIRASNLTKSYYSDTKGSLFEEILEDVEFNLQDIDRINIGESFTVIVNITNKSDEIRNVKVVLSAESVYYTGIKAELVKKAQEEFQVHPSATEQFQMIIEPDEYIDKLVEYGIMKLYAIASVEETKQTWADEDDFQVLKPPIDMEIPNELEIGQEISVKMSFKNPLKKILTNCVFNVAGPGLTKNQMIPFQDIDPEDLVTVDVILVPSTIGQKKLVATFSSNELIDITGSATVEDLVTEE